MQKFKLHKISNKYLTQDNKKPYMNSNQIHTVNEI